MIPEMLGNGEVMAKVVMWTAAWGVILTALVIVYAIGPKR